MWRNRFRTTTAMPALQTEHLERLLRWRGSSTKAHAAVVIVAYRIGYHKGKSDSLSHRSRFWLPASSFRARFPALTNRTTRETKETRVKDEAEHQVGQYLQPHPFCKDEDKPLQPPHYFTPPFDNSSAFFERRCVQSRRAPWSHRLQLGQSIRLLSTPKA